MYFVSRQFISYLSRLVDVFFYNCIQVAFFFINALTKMTPLFSIVRKNITKDLFFLYIVYVVASIAIYIYIQTGFLFMGLFYNNAERYLDISSHLVWSLLSGSYFILYVYSSVAMLMLVSLSFMLLSYSYIGYSTAFYFYTLLGVLFIPISLNVLLYSFVFEFSLSLTTDNYILFFSEKQFIFSLKVDNLSVIFSSTTFIIGFFTGFFQYVYMSDDSKKDRFFFFFNYFVFSMVLFVHADNFLLLLFGWELLGITSFFLIIHYDIRYMTIKAALKAFFFNRLSDVFLLVSIAMQFTINGSFSMFGSSPSLCSYEDSFLFISILFLVLASLIKSAQMFFFF